MLMKKVKESRMNKDAYDNIVSVKGYVAKCENKDKSRLEQTAFEWLKVSAKNKMSYETEWFGMPIIQTPEDIVLMQELIFKIKPDFVIETGIAHGGSLILYASLFEALGKGKVIGVDIDIRKHNRDAIESHPLFKRIELIQGSSISEEVIEKLQQLVPKKASAVVCLDSNHYRGHVLNELKLYRQFVNPCSYIVVFDTISSALANSGIADKSYQDNGPMEAINDFLKIDDDFVIDEEFNKLYLSMSHNGYLRRLI